MPRDGSGVYTLPAGNPVVTNTVIASTWANGTMSDIAAQLNNVLTRDGLLGPTGPFKLQDGTVAAPGLAWNSEPGLGWYRSAASTITMAAGGSRSFVFYAPDPASTIFQVLPRQTNGGSLINMLNSSGTNTGNFYLGMSPDGTAHIGTTISGTGAASYLSLEPKTGQVYLIGAPNASLAVQAAAGGSADLTLRKSGNGVANNIWGYNGVNPRWIMQLGSEASETGGNAGSTFAINRYADGGGYLGTPFQINRADGSVSVQNFLSIGGGLQIAGNIAMTGAATSINWSSGGSIGLAPGSFPAIAFATNNTLILDATGGTLVWQRNSVNMFNVYSTGEIGITGTNAVKGVAGQWNGPSDVTLKENIAPLEYGLAEVLQLVPITFDMIDGGKGCVGVSAQDVEAVMPRMVFSMQNPLKTGFDDAPDPVLGIKPDFVQYALVNAIKTLNDRLTALETA